MTSPTNPSQELHDLADAITELMDNYHEHGEFHEYTHLEKYRHAKSVIATVLQTVREGLPEEREGIQEYTDKDGEPYHTCTYCGGYDECDCSGFNEALTEVTNLLNRIEGKK